MCVDIVRVSQSNFVAEILIHGDFIVNLLKSVKQSLTIVKPCLSSLLLVHPNAAK